MATNEQPTDSQPDDVDEPRVDSAPNTESVDSDDVSFGSISMLIPPVKAGDPSARDQLLRELQGYLEATARKHLDPTIKHKAGASDIVQQSFIQIIENFEKFRGQTSAELRGWINTIVVNEMNGVRRKFRTAKRDVTQEKPIQSKSSTSPGNVPSDASLTPSSAAIQAERQRKFHETLELLSAEHAEVIRLRNIDRLPFKTIGQRMGRSENAVSKLWYRAILQFEEKLRGQDVFQDET